jgi:hypothetical protein
MKNMSNQELYNLIQQQNTIIEKQMNIIQNIYQNQKQTKVQNKQEHNSNTVSIHQNKNRNTTHEASKIKIKDFKLKKYNKNYKQGMYNNNIYNNIL